MKHLLIFLWCSLMATAALPQSRTVFFEDFETETFETSVWPNWNLYQSDTLDYWIVGACADKVTPVLASASNKVAYITTGTEGANAYAGKRVSEYERQVHFYKDVHLHTDSVYVLTFDWKSKGSGNTCLKISGSTNTYVPTGGIIMADAPQIGPNFVGTGEEWQFASITFAHTATEDRRLFFTWAGSSITSYNPPPAVDNIRLTAYPKNNPKTVNNLQAGSLKNQAGIKEATGLTVTGSPDASDFAFMRDSMPVLQTLNLSGATIAEIPENAFYNGISGKTTLTGVTFPNAPYTIGAAAFRECTGLTGALDLSKATAIGRDAFRACTGLTGNLNLAAATSIGNAAFFFTSSSASGKFDGVTLSGDLTVIGDSAFNYAFYNATGDLTVPASVTSIGEKAFNYYAYNKNEAHQLIFTAPSELTTIGANAFQNLRYFSGNLVIPASVTSIGDNAFSSYGSSSSTAELSLSFAQSSQLTTIGNSAFSGCSKFTGDLALPDGVTSIGNSAFYGCSGLDGALTLPSALESIGSSAFSGCSHLQFPAVTIPSEMTKVESSTFYNCIKLTSVTLHDGITEIGSSALYGTGITAIDLKKVTTIGSSAFQSCTALTSINIPYGVTQISSSTFYDSGLDTVTLPATLNSIAGSAFRNCTNLSSITVLATTPPTLGGAGASVPFYGVTLSSVELKVPTSSTGAYGNADTWKDFKTPIGGGYSVSASSNDKDLGVVEGIENKLYPAGPVTLTATPKASAFINWTTGDGTTISANTTLELNVQSDTVVTANFGNVLDTLCEAGTLNAVSNIKTYSRITLAGTINAKDIAYMRDSLPDLKELFLSGTTIEAYTGTEGTLTGEQAYPAGTLPQNAFYGKALIALTLPDNLVAIGANALRGCSDIRNALAIPQDVTSIGAAAFYNCSMLTGNLALPAELTYVADSTFYGCSGLRGDVVIPAGVTSIGSRAFQSCSGLTALSLPKKLTSIRDHAFRGCSGLTSVTAHNPVPVSLTLINGVWAEINPSCILHVATSAVAAYQSVPGWNVFQNIQGDGFLVTAEPNSALLGTVTGLEDKFYQRNEAVLLIATSAPGFPFVNWTSNGVKISEDMTLRLTITQDTAVVANFVNEYSGAVTAGQLHAVAGIAQKSKLILSGTLDARDFAFMRDGMPNLVDLDIAAVSIVEYRGADGAVNDDMLYAANKIPQRSFYGKSLVSVKLPAGTTLIGEGAFRNTAALTGIEIPAKVTAIEDYAFNGSNIARITFAENAQLTTIGDCAFENSKLTGLVLPAELTAIGDYAFSGCMELAGSLTVPAKVSAIGRYAFAKNDVYNSSNKITSVTFPASLQTIGEHAFKYSKLLESIHIEEGLKSIGEHAFEGCLQLKGELRIPTTMTSVATYAFAGAGIQYLVLHKDITELGNWAFANNPFDSVRVYSPTPLTLRVQDANPFFGVNSGSIKRPLLVPEGSYSYYLKADVWKEFEFGNDDLMYYDTIDYGNRDWRIETDVNNPEWGEVEDITPEDERGMPNWIRKRNSYNRDEYYYIAGQTATLKATPTGGNSFVNWTAEAGDTLSTDAEYSFEVTGKAKLTANFASGNRLSAINAPAVQVYPNPAAKGVLTVEYGSLNPGDKLSVYDISGVFVAAYEATGTKTALDITRLSSGSYLLKAGAVVLKFVVIR